MNGDIDIIIERAGGAEQVAKLTGVGLEAVRKWRQARAIPSKHWATLLRQPGITLADLNPGDAPADDATVAPDGATAALLLADGSVFWGRGFGAHSDGAVGELCFSTGLTGYQETLTDPSFAGQIITFTFPHIGNVGTNDDDCEAGAIAALGAVVRCDPTDPASWRSTASLDTWLSREGKPGIAGVDTRAVTRRLRDGGPQTALLAYPQDGRFDLDALRAKIAAWPGLEGMDLSKVVTCTQSYTWDQGVWERNNAERTVRRRVVAVDYGAKRNILRCLVSAGCDVTVVPADATADDILRHKPEGVFLSNGPGDPAATGVYAVPAIRGVLEAGLPVFGICLGHQLLALALGARTYKLERGHRGANQPVKDLSTGKVEITSQNHGFAVDDKSLPEGCSITHVSLFDGSNEGIRSDRYDAFSVQYHPEASPGPSDSFHLFERFVSLMDEKAGA
ncbi:glutamine-hydrolyzing carbamoyl-phosphate synthase small subunit [Tanticharoenia sakaeratensis]|uniref:Carbamoyl phosphate synthase small chain n=1 Tax=Tanticharoenia sakaeratensis NBRC 103193 TaxID=1231623 RepID=A0A0D6MJ38_9PROT|nr:glutamine-hydrolyzing carbamoyl-phosphate synthase small subunit [Tanticharoenia sakaeratensis]GAN53674.1 carbamoyl phosphate synthase small subunit [Tanticharoenia sakaeratensis NBRC 103193]GBQ17212.1 carbamoyl phosphate synthase small subunit [Tanticharoenia sakaeratensis NBRC 103193]